MFKSRLCHPVLTRVSGSEQLLGKGFNVAWTRHSVAVEWLHNCHIQPENESVFESAVLPPDDLRKASETRNNLMRVSLKVRNNRLWLQGTLPLRPCRKHTKPHRQSITTKQPFTAIGLRLAIDKARQLDAQLVVGTFDWADWANLKQKPLTSNTNPVAQTPEIIS